MGKVIQPNLKEATLPPRLSAAPSPRSPEKCDNEFNIARINYMFVSHLNPGFNGRDRSETSFETCRHRGGRRASFTKRYPNLPICISSKGATGHLNPPVLKGMSAVVINVYIPCLVFSNTVPSFTSDNLSEVGVLILTAVFYQSIVHFVVSG
jgi:hypothetical protein